MATYLLTHNPKTWNWVDLEIEVQEVKSKGYHTGSWSCGRTKRIVPGDRFFLFRQGVEPRGIFGSGKITSRPYSGEGFSEKRKNPLASYIDVKFESLLMPDTDSILEKSKLSSPKLSKVNWQTQASGISIPDDAAQELNILWQNHLSLIEMSLESYPDESEFRNRYFEGSAKKVYVNKYERDPLARDACLSHYGFNCSICNFNFENAFGSLGKGFIHVHHIKPLSQIKKNYKVDPINDLIPICPNCHAMIHKNNPVYSIEELKTMRKMT